jgi:signal transduction histidine kinase
MFPRSRAWLLVLFTVGLIVLVNLAWWVFYDRTERLLDRQLGRRLSAVASTAAVFLPPELVERLAARDIEAYSEAINVLEDVRLADSLSEVFIVDENYNYLVTTSLDMDTTYFMATLNAPYIDSLLTGLVGGAVPTASYKTGDIYLKSAFCALVDTRGDPLAVLGVEADVDYSDALVDLKRNLYYSTLLSVVVGLIVGLVFLWLQHRVNRSEAQLFLGQTHAYLGRMVAVVSHEIKNPLMIIRSSAERLLKREKTTEGSFIVEEVDRLNQIVTGYLSFARGTGGRESLVGSETAEPVNLTEFVANIKKHLVDKYRSEQIDWLTTPASPDVIIVTYPRSLRQVVMNLLINGVDACREANRPLMIGLTVEDKGDQVALTVTDRGPGITRKQLKTVFDPFYTTKQSGSGLGLYIAKKIVAEMGGDLVIESTLGEKTVVTITLPKGQKR